MRILLLPSWLRLKRGLAVHCMWRGGATTSSEVPVSVGRFAWMTGAKQMEETILEMARAGEADKTIADHLTSQGHRSPRGEVVLESTVKIIRLSHNILHRAHQSHPRRVDGYLTTPQLAKKLGVPKHWIYDRINNGTIAVKKDDSTGGYLFHDKPETIRQFRQLRDGQTDQVGY